MPHPGPRLSERSLAAARGEDMSEVKGELRRVKKKTLNPFSAGVYLSKMMTFSAMDCIAL